jgi:N-acetylneuraminic acid mutarotase
MPAAHPVRTTGGASLVAVTLLALVLCGCSDHRASASAHSTTTSSTQGGRVNVRPHAASPASNANAQPIGQRFEPSLPVARQEGAAAAAGDRLYAIGGYDSARNSTSDVFVFDGSSWHSGPALPIAVNHPAAAALGGRVYVVGGFTSGGATDRAFVLKPHASAWSEIAPMHRARGALALVALHGDLYAIGGRDGSVEIGVPEVYDARSNTWSDLPPMTAARNHLAGYTDLPEICAAGGRTPLSSGRIDCFDPAKQHWILHATLPIATSGAAAAAIKGTTVVAGGESAGETSLVGSVQMLHAGKWQSMPMLVPRHGTAFARYRGRLWLCGGATSPGYAAVTTCTSIGS